MAKKATVLMGLTLLFFAAASVKVGLKSLVFYPPEFAIYLWLIVALVSIGWQGLLKTFSDLPKQVKLAVIFIVIGSLLGTFFSPLFPTSLGALKTWMFAPMLMALLLIQADLNSGGKNNVLTLLAIVLIALGLWHFGSATIKDRLAGVYQSPNIYAELLAPLVAYFYIAVREKKSTYILTVLFLAMMAIMLLLTRSLGGILALVGVVGIYEATRHRRWSYWLIGGLIILSLLTYQRLNLANNSFESRPQIWHVGLAMTRLWPVTGAGLRGFEYYYPSLVGQMYVNPIEWSVPQAHNLLLSVWTNIGLFGLLGFIQLFWFVFSRKRLSEPSTWALLAIFLHGLVDTPYWRIDLAILFWFYLALFIAQELKHSHLDEKAS